MRFTTHSMILYLFLFLVDQDVHSMECYNYTCNVIMGSVQVCSRSANIEIVAISHNTFHLANIMAQNWVAEPCPSAPEALDQVGAYACSNISTRIVADNGRAWRRRQRWTRNRNRDSIFCQNNFTHVWTNLENQFGTGSTARIKQKGLCPGKQVIYLLCNTRTVDRVAIGKVRGGLRIWRQFQDVSDVPEDVAKDIVALVAHLWTGEKWGVTSTVIAQKSAQKRARPEVCGNDDL